jgi:hypothetical protein
MEFNQNTDKRALIDHWFTEFTSILGTALIPQHCQPNTYYFPDTYTLKGNIQVYRGFSIQLKHIINNG